MAVAALSADAGACTANVRYELGAADSSRRALAAPAGLIVGLAIIEASAGVADAVALAVYSVAAVQVGSVGGRFARAARARFCAGARARLLPAARSLDDFPTTGSAGRHGAAAEIGRVPIAALQFAFTFAELGRQLGGTPGFARAITSGAVTAGAVTTGAATTGAVAAGAVTAVRCFTAGCKQK